MEVSKSKDLPAELKALYDILYSEINDVVKSGEFSVELSDLSTVRVLIESAMTIVENYRDADGNGWSGPEKKKYALMLIRLVIQDLAKEGKIDKAVAKEIVANLDVWGSLAMDIAVDAAKKLFDVGQEFVQDVQSQGFKSACKENCCCIIS